MESANGTVKVECVNDQHFKTRAEAERAIVEYIGYYNTERRHSALGNCVFHANVTGDFTKA